MLIEVIISALLVGLIAVGTYTGLASANRAGAHERANAQATVIAQQDEERLRGLTVKELSDLGSTTHRVAENGMCVEEVSHAWRYYSGATTSACEAVTGFSGQAYTHTVFTVSSSAQFVTAAENKLTCEIANGKADYIQTTSSVNWPSIGKHSPVSQSSLVAVPTSSSLLVKVKNRVNEPVSGAKVEVFDPQTALTAEETTSASGCVIFGDLAEGEVKVVASKENWVGHNGKTSQEKTGIKVKTTSLAETELTLESPGSIEARFIDNKSNNKQLVESFTFVAFQTEIGSPSFFVGRSAANEPSTPASSGLLSSLFPFITPGTPLKENKYTVYAGDCEANNPVEVTKGLGGSNEIKEAPSAQVEPGSTPAKVEIEVPEVSVTAYEVAAGSGNKLTSTSAAILDTECEGKPAQNVSTVPYDHKVEIVTGALKPNHLPYAKKLELCVVGKDGTSYYEYKTKFTNTAKTGTTIPTFGLSQGTKLGSAKTC